MIPSFPSVTFPNRYALATGLYPDGAAAGRCYPARKKRLGRTGVSGAAAIGPAAGTLLDLESLERTPLAAEPFEHVVVEGFLGPEAARRAIEDFPGTPGCGAFSPAAAPVRGAFRALMKELRGRAFREAVEAKFGVDLGRRPMIWTVRGQTGPRDGRIHTDSPDKLVTALLYLNEAPWPHGGGRLRLLRSRRGLDDYAVEVAPEAGTLVVFLRSERSWHGHRPHLGPRRAIQLNWMTGRGAWARESARHALAGPLMWLNPLRRAGETGDAGA